MLDAAKLDTAKSLAAFLQCSIAKVRKDTRLTDLPRLKFGRSVRYDRTEVLAWLRARQEQQRNRREGERG